MIPGLNFTSIDFETANRFRRSACSLGMAIVRDGIIVETKYWLIKPDPYEVELINERIHGITKNMLSKEPTFQELWPEVEKYFTDELIVAHNASFDIDVLTKMLDFYKIEFKYPKHFCTHLPIASLWPEVGSTKLADLASYFELDHDHHNALSDAIVSAQIAILMALKCDINDLLKLRVASGNSVYNPADKKNDQGSDRYFFKQLNPLAPADLSGLVFSDIKTKQIDWKEKRVCVTGTFEAFPDRNLLIAKLVDLGAVKQSTINAKTEVVIIGNGAGPSKIKLLKDLLNSGAEIKVLNERQIAMVVDNL